MERAEGSSNTVGAEGSSNTVGGRQRKRQLRPSRAPISYDQSINRLSVEGRRTHMIVNRTRKRLLNTIIGAYSTVFDNTSAPYRWLRSGWLVEERRMVRHGRIYRYYYDPAGQMYNTRHEVDQICSDIEKSLDEKNRVVIVIDDD